MFLFAGNRWQRHIRTRSLFQHPPRRRFSCQLFHGRRNPSQLNRDLIRYHRPLHRDSFSARQRYEQRDAQNRTPRKPQLHGRDRESEKSDSCVREHLVLPAGSSIGFGWIPFIICRFAQKSCTDLICNSQYHLSVYSVYETQPQTGFGRTPAHRSACLPGLLPDSWRNFAHGPFPSPRRGPRQSHRSRIELHHARRLCILHFGAQVAAGAIGYLDYVLVASI